MTVVIAIRTDINVANTRFVPLGVAQVESMDVPAFVRHSFDPSIVQIDGDRDARSVGRMNRLRTALENRYVNVQDESTIDTWLEWVDENDELTVMEFWDKLRDLEPDNFIVDDDEDVRVVNIRCGEMKLMSIAEWLYEDNLAPRRRNAYVDDEAVESDDEDDDIRRARQFKASGRNRNIIR